MNDGVLSVFLEKQRLKKVFPYINGTVLDLGCGNANSLSHVSENYVGVDIDQNKIDFLSKKFPKFTFIVLDLNNEEICFDVKPNTVLMLAVFEHLKNPNKVLSNLKKIMNKKSVLVITSPSKFGGLIHDLGSKIGLFNSEAAKEHEKFYSINEVKLILERNGFIVKKALKFQFGLNQFFLAELK